MNRRILLASLAGNAVLLGALLWMRASHRDDVRTLVDHAVHGDELHLEIHARSLAALESDDPEEVEETAFLLRRIVAAGEGNEALRDELRRAGVLGG